MQLKKTLSKNRSKKHIDFRHLKELSLSLKKKGKKIVFTTGTFDLLNPGHCRYLAEAKAKGDVLIVGISTDESERRLKGDLYPLIGQEIRAEVVSHLRDVDYVTYVDESQPHAILILLQPDVYFTSQSKQKNINNKSNGDKQLAFILKMYGGKVFGRKPHIPYFSSQMLIEHIANIRVMQILEKYLKAKINGFNINSEEQLKPADFGDQTPNDSLAFNANEHIGSCKDLGDKREKWRNDGKKVVFVSGSYDLLHVGHARFIEQAGLLGDVLIVGIPSDKALRELKGLGRPVISEKSRAYVLNHLEYVDNVVIFDDKTVLNSLEILKPDIFFTVDEEWNKNYKKSPEYKLVKGYGGKIVRAKRQSPFLSASKIIDKVAQQKVREIFAECMKEELYTRVLSER